MEARSEARALSAGALAGFAGGLLDGLIAWPRMGGGAGARIAGVIHAATLEALVLALALPVVVAGVLALDRWTVLGRMWRAGLAAHDEARARDPRDALTGLALGIVGLPCVAAALAGAHTFGVHTLATRHHHGLSAAVIIGATLGALIVAGLLTIVLGRVVELGLRGVCKGSLARPLSSPWAPVVAVGGLVAVAGAIGVAASWGTLRLVPLRWLWSTLGTLALVPAAWRVAGRLPRLPGRGLGHAGVVAVIAALALGTGGSEAARKAAAKTGLAAPIGLALQRLSDVDGDGAGAILGGGDCAPFDRARHPGAVDIPDDGIDQNCLGGDVTLKRAVADAHFVARPTGVPADLNVLFITIDTLRADHVGAYGYARATTPALDAIARDGAVFENAWAHAPSTRYSMPALLTGRYPSQVAWDPDARTPQSWWPGLQLENTTIAEVMKAAGLSTGAITNYHYFDKARRMDQGFDSYDNSNARLHAGADPASTHGTSSREQADKSIAFVEAHAGGRWFLWVHFYDPHHEYELHPGTTTFGDDAVARYDHEIRFTDDQIARVVDRLRSLGIYDKTAIVVTGDHGEGFGEHGIQFHGYDLYGAQTRVPLIVRVPGIAPARPTLPAGHVDVLPTLANLIGAAPVDGTAGRSLLDAIAGQLAPDADREIFQEVKYEGPTEKYAVATRCKHLLYSMRPANTWELYDTCADRGENQDRAGELDGAEGRALKGKLLAWIDLLGYPVDAGAKIAAALLTADPTPNTPTTATLDGVTFLGADLPKTAKPGADLDVTWYWRADRALGGDWKIFVHVEGRGARFQGDHDAVAGAWPVARWQAGQQIADHQKLRVPANARGTYTVYVGLWTPSKRKNMAVASGPKDERDRIRVGTIDVAP